MKKILILFAVAVFMPALLAILTVTNLVPMPRETVVTFVIAMLPLFLAFPAAFSMQQYNKTALAYGIAVAGLLYVSVSFYGIAIGLITALFGMLAGQDIAEKKSVGAVWMKFFLGFAATAVAAYAIYNKLTGQSVTHLLSVGLNFVSIQITNSVQTLSAYTDTMPADMSVMNNIMSVYQEAPDALQQALPQLKMILPAYLFLFSAILGYLTQWIVALLSKILGKHPRYVPHFSHFHCNSATVWVYFISMFASFFTGEGSVMAYAFANLQTIVSFILTICAMSLIDFLLKRKHWKGILRILVMCGIWLISTSPLVSIVLTLLAFFDARANIRGFKD